MKVGLYFGSFNPIHMGHLALANYICEFGGIDELWFVVSPCNPFKQQSDLMDDNLRLRLVRLAIEGYHRFKACDVEFSMPRPSYTYNTLQRLRELYPTDEFHLVMGADNFPNFKNWYQGEQMLSENQIIIYPRPGYEINEEALPDTVRIVNAPQFEISSTFIRQALAEGRDVRYFLHPSTWQELRAE